MSRLWSVRRDEADEAERSSEAGDTLIEVLLALTILGIAGIALLTGFVTSITALAEHRNLATRNTSLRVATDQVTSFLEQNSVGFFSCSQTLAHGTLRPRCIRTGSPSPIRRQRQPAPPVPRQPAPPIQMTGSPSPPTLRCNIGMERASKRGPAIQRIPFPNCGRSPSPPVDWPPRPTP